MNFGPRGPVSYGLTATHFDQQAIPYHLSRGMDVNPPDNIIGGYDADTMQNKRVRQVGI